jgi:hypothetical protein
MINLPMLTSKLPGSRFGGTFLSLSIMRITILAIVFILVACNSDNAYKKAENAQDAGREFIRASLDGNYEKAEYYLLQDSTNRLLIGKRTMTILMRPAEANIKTPIFYQYWCRIEMIRLVYIHFPTVIKKIPPPSGLSE